mmetsp:Transcript_23738/g.41696  ORF Transcript_23738/g.41696 Transcript_23738/m.41696 type:complete len:85 (+) Transcript_23738:91-345(+)
MVIGTFPECYELQQKLSASYAFLNHDCHHCLHLWLRKRLMIMQAKKRRKESVVLEDEEEKDIEQEEKGEKEKVEDATIFLFSCS